MIDSFDFKEPSCSTCGGKEFYNPDKDAPISRIPVKRIIEKVDAFFNKNDFNEAGRLLEYWQNEAKALKDEEGELSIDSELVGFYRKTLNKEKEFAIIDRTLFLLQKIYEKPNISSATIMLNIATAYKAFNEINKSIFYYQKTLEIYNDYLDKNDEKFAGLFNNFALALVDAKDYKKAKEYYSKAIEIMKKIEGGENDLAITYVNLAHLIEVDDNDRNKIVDVLFTAYQLLSDEKVVQNGYHAYVLEKCAPSFGHFGFTKIENEFLERSKKIYEGN